MRIIAGKWRHRVLSAPVGAATRPTSDRLREALFASLGERVRGAIVVDAYAGSGAIGFEALSRGAARVLWIESAPAALSVLRANAAALDVAAPEIFTTPFLRAVNMVARRLAPRGADFWYLDPPYEHLEERTRALDALARHTGLVSPGGIVMIECRARAPRPDGWPPGWSEIRRLRQGEGEVVFLAPPNPAEPASSRA